MYRRVCLVGNVATFLIFLQMNDAFLKPSVVKLNTGVLFEVISSAVDENARSPLLEDKCDVAYVGFTRNGTEFENNVKERKPEEVIEGWKEAMQLMVEGDRWRLYLPYYRAYGEDGVDGKIPPYAPLIYELELLKVNGEGKSMAEAKAALKRALLPPERDPTSPLFIPPAKSEIVDDTSDKNPASNNNEHNNAGSDEL